MDQVRQRTIELFVVIVREVIVEEAGRQIGPRTRPTERLRESIFIAKPQRGKKADRGMKSKEVQRVVLDELKSCVDDVGVPIPTSYTASI